MQIVQCYAIDIPGIKSQSQGTNQHPGPGGGEVRRGGKSRFAGWTGFLVVGGFEWSL